MSASRAQTVSGLRTNSPGAPRYAAGARFLPESARRGEPGGYLPTRSASPGHGARFLLDGAGPLPAPVIRRPERAEMPAGVGGPARVLGPVRAASPARAALVGTPTSQDSTAGATRFALPARAQDAAVFRPDGPGSPWTPARALVPAHAVVVAHPADPLQARRSRRFSPKTLISSLGVVAVAGSLACFGISTGAAATGAQMLPGPSIQNVLHATATSRELSHAGTSSAEPTGSAASSPAAGSATASASGGPSATSAPANATSPAVSAPAPTATASPTPTVRASVDGIIAPAQKTPLSVADALAKAKSLTGNQDFADMCLALVANFYGYTSSGEEGAQQAAAQVSAAGQMHTDMSTIPLGALIWYNGDPVGNPYGHVAMYAGDGKIYSNGAGPGGQVGLISIDTPATSWGEPVIGWSGVWLPNATT